MKNTKDNSCTANTLDWNPLADLTDTGDIAEAASPFLETQEYASHTEYDALNRPISLTTPDGSVNLPTYNEAGLLDKVQACLRGASVDDTTPFVTNINYDANGQRELVEYANGVYTEYTYDPLTFRVIRIRTIRTKDNACLQDLNYTYDPVGNITELRDNAQKTIFYDNARVEPVNSYEYDALYRLICAEGREHAGQNANAQPGHHNPPIINTPHPNDAQAMRNYTEEYGYDEVGNILCMDHNFANGGWKRNYQYEDVSNRLESTSLPGDDPEGPYGAQYGYDAHGNMTGMPHLQEMCWDFKDQMCQVDLDGGGTAYYIYDAGGQRARKVHEHNGSTVEERIYLGGYEIYRKHNGTGLTLERETLHIMDDQQRIALLETKTVENGSEVLKPKALVQYQLNNHLGSSSLELDGDGVEISYEEYYSYGSTSYQAVDKNIKAAAKRYRYTGKERDDETGLYYYGARYYAAWLGRWVSCDPSGIGAGINMYLYVKANPIQLVDKKGMQDEVSSNIPPFPSLLKPPEELLGLSGEELELKLKAHRACVSVIKQGERQDRAEILADQRYIEWRSGIEERWKHMGEKLASTPLGSIGFIIHRSIRGPYTDPESKSSAEVVVAAGVFMEALITSGVAANKYRHTKSYLKSPTSKLEIEVETKHPYPVKPKDVTGMWEEYLGEYTTEFHPFTGKKDKERIFSLDVEQINREGEIVFVIKAVRYTRKHEMKSPPCKQHFHLEELEFKETDTVIHNLLVRFPEQQKKQK